MVLHVKLKKVIDDSYPVYIQPGILEDLPRVLGQSGIGHRFVIITDSRVKNLYGVDFLKMCRKEKLNAEMLYFQNGESSKRWNTVTKLLESMAELGCLRDTAVIALGGGVVGDIAGLTASLYMRGLPYVQIPTTTMAMADSSIGGKTGVNSQYGKNLFGTFYQPKAVFIDTDFLNTLAKKEFLNGIVEIIKHGVILDPGLFRKIEKHHAKLVALDQKFLNKILARSCAIKKEVVEEDELENGPRMVLNFGHTIGHALEKISRYQLPHGEAVALGMVAETKIAVGRGMCKVKLLERIVNLFSALGLPTEIAEKETRQKITEVIELDKKARNGKVRFILPRKLGKVIIVDDVSKKELMSI